MVNRKSGGRIATVDAGEGPLRPGSRKIIVFEPPDFLLQPRGNRTGLAIWVANARADYRRGKLCPERIQELNELGFQWRLR